MRYFQRKGLPSQKEGVERGGRHRTEGGHLVHLQVYSYSTMLSVILGIAPQDVFVDLFGLFYL